MVVVKTSQYQLIPFTLNVVVAKVRVLLFFFCGGRNRADVMDQNVETKHKKKKGRRNTSKRRRRVTVMLANRKRHHRHQKVLYALCNQSNLLLFYPFYTGKEICNRGIRRMGREGG